MVLRTGLKLCLKLFPSLPDSLPGEHPLSLPESTIVFETIHKYTLITVNAESCWFKYECWFSALPAGGLELSWCFPFLPVAYEFAWQMSDLTPWFSPPATAIFWGFCGAVWLQLEWPFAEKALEGKECSLVHSNSLSWYYRTHCKVRIVQFNLWRRILLNGILHR